MSDNKAYIPNSFQNPNLYVDLVMELLTPEEFKCLTFAVRHIYGWRDKIAKKRGRISMSAFTGGYQTRDGQRYGGTGMSYQAVSKALNALVEYGLLIRVGSINQDGQEWEISTDIRYDLLQERQGSTQAKRRKQTARARQAGTQSDLVPEGSVQLSTPDLSATEYQTSVQLSSGTQSDLGNQIHVQTNEQTDIKNNASGEASSSKTTTIEDDKDIADPTPATSEIVWLPGDDPVFADEDDVSPELYACAPADINALIAAWWDWTPVRPVKRGKVVESKAHFANKENRAYAENLVQRGVQPADFIHCLTDIRHNPDSRWKYALAKDMTFCYVAPIVEDWIQTQRSDDYELPRFTARRPDAVVNLGEIVEGDNLIERMANHPDLIVDYPRRYITPQQAAGETVEADESDTYSASEQILLEELAIPL
jgi:hypothetical protein